MIYYNRSLSHDNVLVKWFYTLLEGPDLDLTFTKSLQTPSAFLQFFQPPRDLLFEVDEQGMAVASWFDPVMDGSAAFMGLWIAPKYRHTKAAYQAVIQMYRTAFTQYHVLFGITKQEKLLEQHTQLGYTILGKFPSLWDGRDAWVVSLTREAFDGRRRRGKGSVVSGASVGDVPSHLAGSGEPR